jgi:hypothetical protein
MVRKKYTEEQIIAVLKEAEAGAKLPDLCRKYGCCRSRSVTALNLTLVSEYIA